MNRATIVARISSPESACTSLEEIRILDLSRLRGHPEKHGRGTRRRFLAEYKAEAVRLVGTSGKSISAIARELGLGETALRR